VFTDLTDWSIVQLNSWPDYRYNDRALMRVFTDYCTATYEFLVAMNAASASPDYAAGPIWAIFVAEAVAWEQWQVTPHRWPVHGQSRTHRAGDHGAGTPVRGSPGGCRR